MLQRPPILFARVWAGVTVLPCLLAREQAVLPSLVYGRWRCAFFSHVNAVTMAVGFKPVDLGYS